MRDLVCRRLVGAMFSDLRAFEGDEDLAERYADRIAIALFVTDFSRWSSGHISTI